MVIVVTDTGKEHREQNIFLYDRQKLEMTGVTDVLSFSDTSLEMSLEDGCIAVDGENLKIESFSSGSGKLLVSGKVSDISYFGKSPTKQNKARKKRG